MIVTIWLIVIDYFRFKTLVREHLIPPFAGTDPDFGHPLLELDHGRVVVGKLVVLFNKIVLLAMLARRPGAEMGPAHINSIIISTAQLILLARPALVEWRLRRRFGRNADCSRVATLELDDNLGMLSARVAREFILPAEAFRMVIALLAYDFWVLRVLVLPVLAEVVTEMVLPAERLAVLARALAVVAVVRLLLAPWKMALLIVPVQIGVALKGFGAATGIQADVALVYCLLGKALLFCQRLDNLETINSWNYLGYSLSNDPVDGL